MLGASPQPVLEVRNLVVEFSSEDGPLRAVDEVSFQIRRGEIVGLVGESGAGKSLTSEAWRNRTAASIARAIETYFATRVAGSGRQRQN